jgi:predicted TIM-barrel fold metal-dependent hydrolase
VIDVSCFVGVGALTSARVGEPDVLAALLRRAGVSRAAVSPMAGLFVSDPAANDELTNLPAFFRPVPIVDPRWPDPGLSAHRHRGCRAVRICPGSHGYPAADAAELKRTCGALGLTLVLQVRVADPRNLPAGLDLPPVDPADVMAIAAVRPAVPMIVAGATAAELRTILPATPETVLADTSLAEEPDVVRRAVAAHGAHRLLVGTHAPFLTPEAARQKLAAARLAVAHDTAVRWGNAARLGL